MILKILEICKYMQRMCHEVGHKAQGSSCYAQTLPKKDLLSYLFILTSPDIIKS